MQVISSTSSRARPGAEVRADARGSASRVVVDEVHLVDGQHDPRDPSSPAIAAWRRLWVSRPSRASTSTTATSAVEAPVTMLRVYCAWPGRVGDDEPPPRGREVPVRDVDRDALLALGAQAVGEPREVRAPLRPPGRRAATWSRRAGGRSASTCRRRPSRRWRSASSAHRAGRDASEVALALAVLHRGLASTRSSARVSPRSVIRVAAISAITSSSVAAARAHRARARHVAHRAVADRLGERLLAVERSMKSDARRASRRARTPRARARSRSTASRGPRCGCTPTRRARSSWRSGTRARARRGARGRCRGSTAPRAGGAGPTARSRRGRRRSAPSPAPAPRRGARRRTRRRSRAPRSRRAASWSAAGCASARAGLVATRPLVDRLLHRGDDQPSGTRRSRNSIDLREVVPRVDVHDRERQLRPAGTPSRARRSSTIESLPPVNSSTGSLQLGRHLADDVDRLGLEDDADDSTSRSLHGRRARRSRIMKTTTASTTGKPASTTTGSVERRPCSSSAEPRGQQDDAERGAQHVLRHPRGERPRRSTRPGSSRSGACPASP